MRRTRIRPVGGRTETRIGAATTAHHRHRHEERSCDAYQEDEGREDDRDKDVRIHRSRPRRRYANPCRHKRLSPSSRAPFCYCQRRRTHAAGLSGSGPISTATRLHAPRLPNQPQPGRARGPRGGDLPGVIDCRSRRPLSVPAKGRVVRHGKQGSGALAGTLRARREQEQHRPTGSSGTPIGAGGRTAHGTRGGSCT